MVAASDDGCSVKSESSDNESITSSNEKKSTATSIPMGEEVTRKKLVTTLIICLCNLLNFMDRYALPGKISTSERV